MPKDFGHWLSTPDRKQPLVGGASVREFDTSLTKADSAPPELLREVTELEEDLRDRARNLYPVDVPRGQDSHVTVMKILESKVLPKDYASSTVWQHAHQLYWQIQAFKKTPDAVMWHPV